MLQRAGVPTASSELLLSRMRAKVDGLYRQRDRLRNVLDGRGQLNTRRRAGVQPEYSLAYLSSSLISERAYASASAVLVFLVGGCAAHSDRSLQVSLSKDRKAARPPQIGGSHGSQETRRWKRIGAIQGISARPAFLGGGYGLLSIPMMLQRTYHPSADVRSSARPERTRTR